MFPCLFCLLLFLAFARFVLILLLYQQVAVEESKIKSIHEKTAKISKLVQALATSVAGEEDAGTESKMNDIVDSVTILIGQISKDIKEMKGKTETLLDQNSAEARIQKNVESGLLRKLQAAMHEFWCVQQRFRAYSRERYIRQCKIGIIFILFQCRHVKKKKTFVIIILFLFLFLFFLFFLLNSSKSKDYAK